MRREEGRRLGSIVGSGSCQGPRLLACLAVLVQASVALPQAKAQSPQPHASLVFSGAGPREVWVAPSLPTTPNTNALKTEAKVYDLPLANAKPADKVFVWDRTTGNVAIKPVAEAQAGWTVKPADFKLVGIVRVLVEHKGKALAAAKVDLKDSRRTQTQVLDPSVKGTVEFACVAPGPISVSVQYRSTGKTVEPYKVGFEVALRREKPEPVFAVSIPDEVETVSEERPAPKAGQGREVGGAPPNPLRSLLVALLVLAGAITAIYYGMLLLRNNPEKVKAFLGRFGVAVPEPPEQIAGTAPPPAPSAPEPPQKIILDDASVAAPIAPISVSASDPRLVGDGGTLFRLAEGSNVVSREGGTAIGLVGESSVSRRHAELVRSGDEVTVTDLGSTNGTYVNGVKLVGTHTLKTGDDLVFGVVHFRFEG